MRLGMYDISSIKNKILADLYGKQETKLNGQRKEIAKQNRELLLKEFKVHIDSIPTQLFHIGRTYQLFINYKPLSDPDTFALSETWEVDIPDQSITPRYSYNMGLTKCIPPTNLNPKLFKVTSLLCEEIIALNEEKATMQEFLNMTTTRYTGTLQLRKIWPKSLHKYLPPEPIKQAKLNKQKKKTVEAIIPAPPEKLKERLTTNLLEGP